MAAGLGLVALAIAPCIVRLEPRVLAPRASAILPVDVLGVARDDFVFADGQRVLLKRFLDDEVRTAWQDNFAEVVNLTGAMDVAGDGLDRICLAVGDSTGAEAVILDGSGRRIATIGPIHGVSSRPGFPWDGRIHAAASVSLAGRRKIVGLVFTGYARTPRGIALYDLATLRQESFFPMGAYPTSLQVAELDGGEAPELLVTTFSPDNQVSVNGTDDARCYVLALDTHGRRVWQVALGGLFARSQAAVLPADESGRAQVVASFASDRAQLPEPGRLLLLDGPTGRVLARREFAGGLGRPRPLGSSGLVVVGSEDGRLRLFGPGLRFIRERRFDRAIEAWAVADFDEDGSPEVVASTAREVLVLDERLGMRARLRLEGQLTGPPTVMVARAGLGRRRLAISDGRALVADVAVVPPLRDAGRLAVVLALALVAGTGRALWRTPRRWRGLPAGAAAREFLVDYHQIRHETFGHERPFARVRLWAQARAAGESPPAEMLESACEEFERIGLPTLLRYAERAGALRADGAQVRRIRELARAAASSLCSARQVPSQERQALVEGTLTTIGELSELCAEAYWEVAMRKPCRADLVAQEALLAKRPVLERAAVARGFHAEASAGEPVLFDPDELCALLGELLENSARALQGVPAAEVRVTVAVHASDPRWVLVRIADNGPGITPERRDAVFAAENASSRDGGFGLFHAREVARRWLGDLALEDPEGGRGAVVRLSLRACRVGDARAPAGVALDGRTA